MFLAFLLLPFYAAVSHAGCIGPTFESKTFANPRCLPGQSCDLNWNVVVVVAANFPVYYNNFMTGLNQLMYCNSSNQVYFMSPQKQLTDSSCSFSPLTAKYFTDQTQKYGNQQTNFTPEEVADALYLAANCAQEKANFNAGIAYLYIDMDCNWACSSGQFLNYQAYFLDTLLNLQYDINIITADQECYTGLFQQCNNTFNCEITTDFTNATVCSSADPYEISAFEMTLSLAFVLLLLVFLLIINIMLICQKQTRVREAYETLKMKHFPTANDYISTEKRRDAWEIQPENLEVFHKEQLGTGAFAIVFKGRLTGKRPVDNIIRTVHLKSDHTDEVAIKRPPPHADAAAKHDFVEEIRFMKKLGFHTHILGMIGCITTTETPMIVMQYCEQGDLLHFLHSHRDNFGMENCVLKPKELMSLAWQISDGLSLDLIHRDLAARNVLLTNDLTAKISDFGLCRQPKMTDDASIYVSRGGRLPVKWMAPESLREYIFSFHTDVWAFGVVLWEMFSLGLPPFPKINGGAMYDVLETGERLTQVEGMPDEIYILMEKCWKWSPDERATIEEIRDELNTSLSNSSLYYGYLSMPSNVTFEQDEFCEVMI